MFVPSYSSFQSGLKSEPRATVASVNGRAAIAASRMLDLQTMLLILVINEFWWYSSLSDELLKMRNLSDFYNGFCLEGEQGFIPESSKFVLLYEKMNNGLLLQGCCRIWQGLRCKNTKIWN